MDNLLRFLASLWKALLDWLRGVPPPPPPPPPPDINPVAYWKAEYRKEWDRQWALPAPNDQLRQMYEGGTNYSWTYHCGAAIEGHILAFLADPTDPTWALEAFKAAKARMSRSTLMPDGSRGWLNLNEDGTKTEYSHQDTYWAGSCAWFLWELQRLGLHTDERYRADWIELRDFCVMIMDKWWNRNANHSWIYRVVSHILNHSLRAVAALRRLEGVSLPWMATAEAKMRADLTAHFAKFPNAIYSYWTDGRPAFALEDVNHGAFDVICCWVMNRLDPTFMPDFATYFWQSWPRIFDPATRRMTRYVDGTGGVSWTGYVNTHGWAILGATSLDRLKALEQYTWKTSTRADYPFFLGVMCFCASVHGG